MKITFIRVNMFDKPASDAMKPIIFGIIKSLTPPDAEIDFLDERVKKLPSEINSDIIAFSVETFAAKRAYILAKKYKRENNIIAMGGFHISVCPDEAEKYADVLLLGDAEDTWREFLSDYQNAALKPRYVSSENCEIAALSGDDLDKVYKHRYHGIGVYQLSRGCKFSCDFCSIKTMYKNIRRKTPEEAAAELSKTREKIIFFADDNLFSDREYALKLFEKLKPLKKKWACQISMDAARDDELLSAMKACGCFLVLTGFESLNPESLRAMKKSANNSAADYEKIIKNIKKHKMLIYGTFVFGYDGDTTEVFASTLDFAVKNDLAVTNFNPLIPMPGTPVYERMEKEGRLLYKKWWLSDDYRYGETAFLPAKMSPEELRSGCLEIRTKFYSLPCIIKRFFKNPANLLPWNFLVFTLVNFISRKEIRRKQGRLLGGVLGEADVDKA